MADMLMSANNAILATKTSVDGFGLSLANLVASVGVGGFVAIMASFFFFGIGVGGLSVGGIGRIDELFFQPIIATIRTYTREDIGDNLDARSLQTASSLLTLVEKAIDLYQRGNS